MENMMRVLSTSDVCELTGLTPKTLWVWTQKGLVTPVDGGGGQGQHYRYTGMQTLGLAVASYYRSTPRGCAHSYVRECVECFANLSEHQLERQWKRAGCSRLLVVYTTGMDPTPRPYWTGEPHLLDVRELYRDLLLRMEQIEDRLGEHPSHGRVRGLANAAK